MAHSRRDVLFVAIVTLTIIVIAAVFLVIIIFEIFIAAHIVFASVGPDSLGLRVIVHDVVCRGVVVLLHSTAGNFLLVFRALKPTDKAIRQPSVDVIQQARGCWPLALVAVGAGRGLDRNGGSGTLGFTCGILLGARFLEKIPSVYKTVVESAIGVIKETSAGRRLALALGCVRLEIGYVDVDVESNRTQAG